MVLLVLGIAAVIADHLVAARNTTRLADVGSGERLKLGPWRIPAAVVTWIAAVAISVGPILALTYRALLPAPGVPLTWDTVSVQNFVAAVNNPRVINGLGNSVVLSLGAALICGVLGWIIGLVMTRTRARGNTVLTLIVLLPSALPGLIVGVAWLIFARYTGLYNTIWVILGAYVCAFTALVLQAVRAPLHNSPLAMEEAARAAGASRLRALLDTTGVMALPAALSGAVLVIVTAAREMPIRFCSSPPAQQPSACKCSTCSRPETTTRLPRCHCCSWCSGSSRLRW